MEKKTKIIAFTNNKGGSGKTTSCANIGYSLSQMGKRVLMIDGDMQMNLTLSFFKEEEVLTFAMGDKNLYHAIKKQEDLADYIIPTPYDNIDVIPSSTLMSNMEYELFSKWQRELIFRNCLKNVRNSNTYDYILIDAPPTLGGWVMNILCASDYVIVPVEASPWGLFGVANMFEFLNDVFRINEQLSLLGIVITKVDGRKNYYKQTVDAMRQAENVHLFEHIIRIDSEIEWAQDESKPVGAYKKNSRSSKEYMELAKEIDQDVSRS